MITSSITISNKLGLHARASAKLTKLAGTFRCDIHLARGGRRGKSNRKKGVMQAMTALRDLIESKFGEGQ
jgi:phosphocarrier protein HPr